MDQQVLKEHVTPIILDEVDDRVQPVDLRVERARELAFFDAHPAGSHLQRARSSSQSGPINAFG